MNCFRARIAHSEEDLLECAYERLRKVQIELPAEKELQRLTNAALNGFFQDLYSVISSRLLLVLLLCVGASSIACALDVHFLDRSSSSRVVELSGLQRPGNLVSTEDDAGRKCFRADELE